MATNSLNLLLLIGRLGGDPTLTYPADGEPVARFRLATDRGRRGTEPTTDWHDVVCYGRQAAFAGRYLARGRLVFVRGSLIYRAREDANGQARRTAVVVATEVRALDHPRLAADPAAGLEELADDASASA